VSRPLFIHQFDPVTGELLPSLNDVDADELDPRAVAQFGSEVRAEFVEKQLAAVKRGFGKYYGPQPEPEAPVARPVFKQQPLVGSEPLLGEPKRPPRAEPPIWSPSRGCWCPTHVYKRANERELAARMRASQGLSPMGDDAPEPVDHGGPLPRL
jgi:hypothetical protein